MATVTTTITHIGPYSWRADWSGATTYDVALEGRYLYQATTLESLILSGDSDTEPPPLEVIDSTDTTEPESIQYPPFATLQWRYSPTAAHYRIEQYLDSAWGPPDGRTNPQIIQEDGRGYYQADTPVLADATTHQFRVIAVDAAGYESPAREFAFVMVCNPAPPDVEVTWAAGTMTASAA